MINKSEIAYISDHFHKFNLQLQSNGGVTLIIVKVIISSFSDILTNIYHLTEIKKDFAARFTDLFEMNIYWTINPFLDLDYDDLIPAIEEKVNFTETGYINKLPKSFTIALYYSRLKDFIVSI